ncbi:MAG: ATP-binding cassette domain-containing protein [Myxococcota bacterium]
MIVLTGVRKAYGDAHAVGPVDLVVAPRRTTALIGPSGSGKSTLLRMMIGLVAPDAGEVRFDGQALAPDRLAAMRRRMGYVIQDGGLFPHLGAEANVTLVARHLGWEPARMRARVAELASLTRFPESALGRLPVELSGGQRQRVALMRALMLDPDLVLLDEPMAALDPITRSDLQSELRDIFRALGKTVVLVTHDIAEAAFLADTLVMLRDGRVIQSGSIEALVQAPADPFVTRFIQAQRRAIPGLA